MEEITPYWSIILYTLLFSSLLFEVEVNNRLTLHNSALEPRNQETHALNYTKDTLKELHPAGEVWAKIRVKPPSSCFAALRVSNSYNYYKRLMPVIPG